SGSWKESFARGAHVAQVSSRGEASMTSRAARAANSQFTADGISALPSSRRIELAPQAPVRIAYCIDTMQVGGTELNALRTIECIDRSCFDISVISLQPDGPLAERYRAAGVTVHPYRLKSLYAPDTLRQGLRLMRWLRREGIEIL